MLDIMILDNDGNSIDHLTQWDYNQTLVVSGEGLDVTKLSQVHFCNKNSKTAYCVATNVVEGNITAIIPNALLIEPYPIFAYVWYQDGDAGKTQYALTIPVRKRTKPDDFEYEDNSSIIDLVQLKTDVEDLQEAFETFSTTYASTSQYGLVKISSSGAISVSSGVIGVNTSASYGTQKINNNVAVAPATDAEIASLTNSYKPIVPKTLKKAVETIGGILTTLTTNNKSSYTAAINEVVQNVDSVAKDVEVLTEKFDNASQNISELSQEIKYTNNSPTPSTIGGIGSGTTFDNANIKDILDKLLYPYVVFKINTGNESSGTARYIEQGNTATISSVSVNVTKGSKDITSLVINAGGVETSDNSAITKYNALSSGLSDSASIIINYTTPTTGTITVEVTIKDGTTTTTNIIYTYYHVFSYYHGIVNGDVNIAANTITGFGSNGKDYSSGKATKTYTYTLNNQCAVYACPVSYGTVNITDADTGTPYTFERTIVPITNSYGKQADYYVYKLSKPTTGTFKFKFTHN